MKIVVLYNLHPDWPEKDKSLVLRETDRLICALTRLGNKVTAHPVFALRQLSSLLKNLDRRKCIIVNWIEALPDDPHGEVTATRLLERRRFAFTGSPSRTLSLCADKVAVKRRLLAAGLAVPPGRIYCRGATLNWTIFPAIVKSANEHSSAELSEESVARSPAALQREVTRALKRNPSGVMIEAFIAGRELNVTLLEKSPGKAAMLPPVELQFAGSGDTVYTYEDKFADQMGRRSRVTFRCPARLAAAELRVVKKACLTAFRALGCQDYARIDGRLDNDGRFVIFDVNPNPDLCASAESAVSARSSGMSYGRFLNHIAGLAKARA